MSTDSTETATPPDNARPKMDPAIKQLWIAKLRSTSQIFHVFASRDGCCPLGALLQVYYEQTGNTVLPRPQAISRAWKWAGLPGAPWDPILETGYQRVSIQAVNDYMHLSFETIAKLIDRQL